MASLLSVSPSGELLVSLDARPWLVHVSVGTAARMPLVAGAPRPLLERVSSADDVPGTTDIVVVRRQGGLTRLEVRGRSALFETPGWISHARSSRDGRLVALLHHPVIPDDRGDVVLVPLAGGAPRVLSAGWISLAGLAWSPSGAEVWFTATGETGSRTLRAVSLEGRVREIYRVPGNLTLHDVSKGGLVLLAHDTMRIGASLSSAEGGERDVSWLDATLLTDLSPDGATLLFTEFGEGGGARYSASLRPAAGGPAVTLGTGFATALAADGTHVLSFEPSASVGLGLVPTGTGPTTPVSMDPVVAPSWAGFLPGGEAVLVAGAAAGEGVRLWHFGHGRGAGARPVPAGDRRPVLLGRPLARRADGRRRPRRRGPPPLPRRGRRADGASRRLPAASSRSPGSTEGKQLLAFAREGSGADVVRLDPLTGSSVPLRRLEPSDPAGVIGVPTVRVTPDGRQWAWSYARLLSELYVAEGLR